MRSPKLAFLFALLFIFSTYIGAEELLHPLGCRLELAAPTTSAPVARAMAGALPASVDLTPQCPPVFDQGDLGSCCSCSIGYCVKGYMKTVEKNWSNTTSNHQFSPSYVYNQVNGGADNGSYPEDNFALLTMRGADTLADQPYSTNVTAWPTQAQCLAAVGNRDIEIAGATNSMVSDVASAKALIAAGNAISTTLNVDSAWDNLGSGTNYVWFPNGSGIRGGHCVSIVGYDDSVTDGKGHVGAFRVQNSWGTSWAQNGRCWIAYAAYTTSNNPAEGFYYGQNRSGFTSTMQAKFAVTYSQRGSLRIAMGVGSTSSPTWRYIYYQPVSGGDSNANVSGAVDLTDAAQYWPPSSSRPWWIQVQGTASGVTGSITQFSIVYGGQTYNATTTLPVSIASNGTSYAYITSVGATFSVSGNVTSGGSALSGVTVSDGTRSATTDTSGNYTLSGVPAGSYTVTPSKSGVTFSPSSMSVTVSTANVSGVNFAAVSSTYTVSGTVTDSFGAALSGATVSDGTRSATTGTSGTYTLSGVPNGTYTVTPSKSGTAFSPSSRSVTVSGANMSGVNFASVLNTYTVSGTVTNTSGAGLSGVMVSDGTRTATTSSTGAYSITGVPAGSYTLTPSRSGYSFTPASRSVSVTTASVSGMNFTGSVVVVNQPPSILSGPTATPNPASVGSAVQFSVTATDPENDPLTYTWNFGDGQTGTGSMPSHSYASAGTFTASVAVSDGPHTVSGSVNVTVAGGTTSTLKVTSASLYVNWYRTGRDKATFYATISSLPSTFNVSGAMVTVKMGGAPQTFKLNSYGYQVTSQGYFYMRRYNGQWYCEVQYYQGAWQNYWMDEGITNYDASYAPITMGFSIGVGGQTFSGSRNMTYYAYEDYYGQAW